MKCPNCGKEIADDSKFCEFCGTKVVGEKKVNHVSAEMHTVPVSAKESIRSVFSKYDTFSGRAGRPEFWWWTVLNFVVTLILTCCGGVPGALWAIAMLLPSLAVCVRRYHDTNHSGWWILVPIYNIVLWFLPSDPGSNDYGTL